MAEITVVAEAPRPTGSRPARRLRAQGRIPGVIYGHGRDPLPISVDARSLRAALTTGAGLNALLALQLGDETHLTLAREIQRDPVRSTVTHVDFLIVRRDEIVAADVPINLVGEARQVEQADGLVEQILTSLTVHATPANIPSHVEVDISGMTIGDTLRVGDIALPSGVSTELDAEEAVVIAARSAAGEAEEAEEAASDEGASASASTSGDGAAGS
ncbi:MAG TPA: 50S ribosomal protein L25 [Acidimicrobiales bacterium]|jgi:large subunit ribosomal protein L25|nr:50S ribosomal protein L25 [Acidimicrobiales bacterium]